MTGSTGALSDSAAQPPIAAALVNWNGWRDTITCLKSLTQVRYASLDLYLCDNASSDDSVERIVTWARGAGWKAVIVHHAGDGAEASALHGLEVRPRLTVIRNDANAGFARGTNIAIRYALASGRPYEYLWALNTDTLVDAQAVERAAAVLEAQPRAGSVQSLLLGYPNDAILDSAGVRLLRRGGSKDLLHGRPVADLAGTRPGTGPIEVFGCCGASAFYRVAALQQVGLFDEDFFQTNEDVDLACRLRGAGYTALLVPESVVRHKGGVSRQRKRGRMWFIANRAKLRVVARWWPRALGLPALLVGVARAFLAMVRTREVTLADWLELTDVLWREYRASPGEALRRAVFGLGVRGFLG